MSAQRGFAVALALLLLACESGTDPEVGSLSISDLTLPTAIRDSPYNASLSSAVVGGSVDYSWRLGQGSLPAGLTLHQSGALNGTPTESGEFSFDAAVTSGALGPKTGRFMISVIDPLSLATSTERTFVGARENHWRCEFTWTVAAIGGRPTDKAYWEDSTVEFYRPATGVVSVSQMSARELSEWFGEDQINFEQRFSIPFYLAWDAPFEATLNIRYSVTPTFAQSTASTQIDCL